MRHLRPDGETKQEALIRCPACTEWYQMQQHGSNPHEYACRACGSTYVKRGVMGWGPQPV